MGLMSEYINKKLSAADLEKELLDLINQYNDIRDTYLIVYAAAINKHIPDILLNQDDYYTIHDLLRDKNVKKLDMYIETRGGSGEAAEEIVRFLRSKFDKVSFVVAGEAKSAGTLIVLSGDEILMTDTGSLGPIDAQVKIGRSIVSAYDYIEWVKEKRKEAEEKGRLNPFDATMVAQISPGELSGVYHALKFAEDLVVEWLAKYKFKNWTVTETRGIKVDDDMRKQRAEEIAKELINHGKWRTHGRSIKIDDLEQIGLKIIRVDDDTKLKDVVYRIHTVCRLLFNTTAIYKIFATADEKIFKQAIPANQRSSIPTMAIPDVVEVEITCPKCGKKYKIYGKFIHNRKIDEEFKNKGCIPFPKDNKFVCECGYEMDLGGLRNEIEVKTGRKLV
jgi:hypothetical protein